MTMSCTARTAHAPACSPPACPPQQAYCTELSAEGRDALAAEDRYAAEYGAARGDPALAGADEESEREMERERHAEKEAEKVPERPRGRPRTEHDWRPWAAAAALRSAADAGAHCDEVRHAGPAARPALCVACEGAAI